MESKPMLSPREKSLLPETFSSEEDQTYDAASSRTASPTHYQLSYSGPILWFDSRFCCGSFSRSSHTSDLKKNWYWGDYLPGAWYCRVITGTGRSATSISVWQHVRLSTQIRPWDTPRWLRRPPPERKVPDSNPACDGTFPGSSHTSDLKIGTPVATPPGAWRYRVSARTGWPGVSILWLGEMESLVCSFYLRHNPETH